jgi:hypothetical protein
VLGCLGIRRRPPSDGQRPQSGLPKIKTPDPCEPDVSRCLYREESTTAPVPSHCLLLLTATKLFRPISCRANGRRTNAVLCAQTSRCSILSRYRFGVLPGIASFLLPEVETESLVAHGCITPRGA